jgi:hypothetical protein
MKSITMLALALALSSSAQIPDGAAIRGSWDAESGGAKYMYVFTVSGDQLSGVVCTRCADVNNLAFVLDGKVHGDDLSFTLFHDRGDGNPIPGDGSGKGWRRSDRAQHSA